MYITYHTNQYQLKGFHYKHASGPYLQPPDRLGKLPEPEYKPTFLVRVLDMKLIRGSDVNEGYCTLSYSWNQSGDIIEKGEESIRIDKGKHKIIVNDPSKPWKSWGILRHTSRKEEFVKFERLIQRICTDFGISYIWYDQMCINQSNPEEKKHELRQMHRIYGHAYCAVALLPELDCIHIPPFGRCSSLSGLPDTQWFKRLWTLEEAYVSKRILFVGRNAHMWSHHFQSRKGIHYDRLVLLYSLCDKSTLWNVSTALRHARIRTSTKSHDRAFAISYIFPEIANNISFSYDQPLLDLMLQVHTLLAKRDISILCFGSPDEQAKNSIVRHQEDDLLPSWTGAMGIHSQRIENDESGSRAFSDYTIAGTSMHVTSKYIPACKADKESEGAENLRIHTEHISNDSDFCYDIRLSSNSLTYATFVNPKEKPWYRGHNNDGWESTYSIPLDRVSGQGWINTQRRPRSKYVGGVLSVTEECSSCIILSGIPFNTRESDIKMYPVIKQCGDHYKAIGSCTMPDMKYFDPDVIQPKQTFIIN